MENIEIIKPERSLNMCAASDKIARDPA